jgi:uncharacterized protein (DUF58 family)
MAPVKMNPTPPNKISYKPVFTFSTRNRKLQLTREGIGFVILSFTVGMGAINTGNNLLYLILAMCCSFIAVSGILSELTLRNISLEAFSEKSIYANEASPLRIRLTNHKKKIPSYSLRLIFPDSHKNGFEVDRDLYFFHVPAGHSIEKMLMVNAENRGTLKIDQCRLATSFPFGFFVKSKIILLNIDCIVFPEIRPVQLPDADNASLEGEGSIQSYGDELFALREFRPGDSMASVHWKSSAKTDKLRVKEFLSGGKRNYTIFLNLTDPQTNQIVAKDELENRVSESASLAFHLIRRGDEVSLKTHEKETPFGGSEAHLESLMHYLAFAGRAKPGGNKS